MDKLSYINEILQLRSITRTELAKQIGLSYSETQKILKGDRSLDAVSFATMIKMCDALGINIDTLAHIDANDDCIDNTEAMIVIDQHEQDVLRQYRGNKEAQKIVDKILDLNK